MRKKRLSLFFLYSLRYTFLDVSVACGVIVATLRGGVLGAIAGIFIAVFISLLRQFLTIPDLWETEWDEDDNGIIFPKPRHYLAQNLFWWSEKPYSRAFSSWKDKEPDKLLP